jgi:hypothetical protein
MARGTNTGERPLGRLEPEDWEHVERYPFGAVIPATVDVVERTLPLPWWHYSHDQGQEGSCVGHGVAMERAITNRLQAIASTGTSVGATVRYDPIDVWRSAKAIDEWAWTKPEDQNGTSVRAGYEVTRTKGLARVRSMRLDPGASAPTPIGAKPADPTAGVETYRWAQTVDEVRTAIANGMPVVLGVNWYTAFDTPTKKGRRYVLPEATEQLGRRRGGHSLAVYGASDRYQAVKLKNSWGREYPLVWLPYSTLERLIGRENGEAALVTDR